MCGYVPVSLVPEVAKVLDPLELECQAVDICLTWTLGIKLRSCKKESPAPFLQPLDFAVVLDTT